MAREFQADFNTGSITHAGTSSVRRPDAISPDYLTQFSFGPIALQDPSEGILARVWRVRVDGNDVYLARANDANDGYDAEILLFTIEDGLAPVLEVDLAFQQNGDPIVVAERATGGSGSSEVWLYHFDALAGEFTFESLGPGRTPRSIMDRPNFDDSEVLIFFITVPDGKIQVRGQLSDYEDTADILELDTTNLFLEEVALSRQNALEIIIAERNPADGTYSLRYFISPFYPYEGTDDMTVELEPLSLTVEEIVVPAEAQDEALEVLAEPLDFVVVFEDPLIPYESPEPGELEVLAEPMAVTVDAQLLLYTEQDVPEFEVLHEPTAITVENILISQTAQMGEIEVLHEPLSITVA